METDKEGPANSKEMQGFEFGLVASSAGHRGGAVTKGEKECLERLATLPAT